ncbi:MAG TPA: undecaprenyldiphospho-muramoylpentapeptide beta-N-acetylglucosaminyltransferase [Cyclobacteriaceae bacterium]|nr:undecaprenyldiphospho-muramoylpentapeptide beta-N-acetylglucosaminyltransferase [Cyclobacteriaceae bacterium]
MIGLWISGLQRSLSLSNLLFPFKLLFSYLKAFSILKSFKPDAVIGTGGFASGPLMLAAGKLRIPALIQEQNSYAGLTNKKLAKNVNKICVAYEGMEKYFPAEKIVLTGNPIRKDLFNDLSQIKEKACVQFAFDTNIRTILVLGGSLGARTINESVVNHIDKLIDAGVQIIWQTGKLYFDEMNRRVAGKDLRKIRIYDFLTKMDYAYAVADLVISRAGALSISELCLVGKPVVFVPSPNVADDHQTKNAEAIAAKQAAKIIADEDAVDNLIIEALALVFEEHKLIKMSENIKALARPDATERIVDEIEKLVA